MDDKVMVDTSIFIEYFRASGKRKTRLTDLQDHYQRHYISSVAKYFVRCKV